MKIALYTLIIFLSNNLFAEQKVLHFNVESGIGINYTEIKILIAGNEIGYLNEEGTIEVKGGLEELSVDHPYLAAIPTFSFANKNETYYFCKLSHNGSKEIIQKFLPENFKDSTVEVKFDNYSTEIEGFKLVEYELGLSELRKDIANNISYPFAALDNYYEGKVILKLTISEKNTVDRVEVVYTPYLCLAKEAVRVAFKLNKFKSATLNGVPVECNYIVPINFVID